jgi:hypothetical protein
MSRKEESKRMLRMWDVERVMMLNESRVELEKARAELMERYPRERALMLFHDMVDTHQRMYQSYLEDNPFRPTAAVVQMECVKES